MLEVNNDAPITAPLTSAELRWLRGYCDEIRIDADTLLSDVERDEYFYVLLDGELRGVSRLDDQELTLSAHVTEAGTGALLIATLWLSEVMAVTTSSLLRIRGRTYVEKVAAASPANEVLIRSLIWRMQTTEALLREREKMAALGKLAAGLTHELNNPAAAARRAAAQLRDTFQQLAGLALRFNARPLKPDQVQHLSDIQREALDRSPTAAPLDILQRSDREEALATWLDERDITDAWSIAPTLIRAGIDIADLAGLDNTMPTEVFRDAIGWMAGTMTVANLLDEIDQSTVRISELVQAFKHYSYMDQAPMKEIDVHEGLENTLIILGHKLPDTITVIRDYDPNLPRIMAYGSELNQVWTNVIDNAIDALGEQGTIQIRTAREENCLLVEIADDGPGIPPEIQSRIFEPFFTTKGIGAGAGLGLDICYRIVVGRHRGDIRVTSQPGDTRFQVRLPIDLPASIP